MDYISKYFTAEEIDERLFRGTYLDAVKAGFPGTKDEFDKLLSQLGTSGAQLYSIPGDITTLIGGSGDDVVNRVGEVFGTTDGWFFVNQIKEKYIIDKNGITASYRSGTVGAGNYQFYITYFLDGLVNVDIIAKQSEGTGGPPQLNIIGVNISKTTTISPVYHLPGDLTDIYGYWMDEFGTYKDFKDAYDNGKLIVSEQGVPVRVVKPQPSKEQYELYYSYASEDGSFYYKHVTLIVDESVEDATWSDDSVERTYKVTGTLVDPRS